MIRHDAAIALAATAIDFRLSPSERHELDAHLAACPDCDRTVRGLRGDAAAVGSLPAIRLDPARAELILGRVLAPPRPFTLRPLRLALVVALLALLAVGSVLVGNALLRRAAPDDDLSVVPPVTTASAALESAGPSDQIASPQPSGSTPAEDVAVGLDWTQTTLPDLVVPEVGGASMTGVIAGGPGAIAWGQAYAADPPVWTTTDGRTWTRAWVEVPTDWSDENPGTILTIAPGGPGYVAGGFYSRQGTGHRALVWTSVDGRAWDLVPYDPVFEHALIDAIVPWRGELLAFGHWSAGPSGGATDAVLFSSPDGLDWRSEQLALPSGLTLYFGTVSSDRLWAFGGELGADTGGPVEVILGSTDGRTWEPTSLPRYAGLLHPVGEGLVSLVRPVFGDAEPATTVVDADPGVYRTDDYQSWQLLARDPSAVGNDVIQVDSATIMVGDDGAEREAGCGGGCAALAWRSRDGGRTWDQATVEGGEGSMQFVAGMSDGTLVAVGATYQGSGFPSPAAWVSVPTPGVAASSSSAPVLPSPAGATPPPPTDVAATTEGSGAVGTDFTVHLRWTPAQAGDRYRVYEYDTGAGPGYGVCVFDQARAWQVVETGPDATKADVSLHEAVTGAGVRCLYIVAVDAAGVSAPTLAWRSSD